MWNKSVGGRLLSWDAEFVRPPRCWPFLWLPSPSSKHCFCFISKLHRRGVIPTVTNLEIHKNNWLFIGQLRSHLSEKRRQGPWNIAVKFLYPPSAMILLIKTDGWFHSSAPCSECTDLSLATPSDRKERMWQQKYNHIAANVSSGAMKSRFSHIIILASLSIIDGIHVGTDVRKRSAFYAQLAANICHYASRVELLINVTRRLCVFSSWPSRHYGQLARRLDRTHWLTVHVRPESARPNWVTSDL